MGSTDILEWSDSTPKIFLVIMLCAVDSHDLLVLFGRRGFEVRVVRRDFSLTLPRGRVNDSRPKIDFASSELLLRR